MSCAVGYDINRLSIRYRGDVTISSDGITEEGLNEKVIAFIKETRETKK